MAAGGATEAASQEGLARVRRRYGIPSLRYSAVGDAGCLFPDNLTMPRKADHCLGRRGRQGGMNPASEADSLGACYAPRATLLASPWLVPHVKPCSTRNLGRHSTVTLIGWDVPPKACEVVADVVGWPCCPPLRARVNIVLWIAPKMNSPEQPEEPPFTPLRAGRCRELPGFHSMDWGEHRGGCVRDLSSDYMVSNGGSVAGNAAA